MQVVTFVINEAYYGIDIMSVKEISETGSHFTIDNMPEFMKGLIDLRGDLLPFIDSYKRFHLDRTNPVKTEMNNYLFLVIKFSEMLIALEIDRVLKVVDITGKSLMKAPNRLDQVSNNYLLGVVELDDGDFVSILDIDKVLSLEELKNFNKKTTAGKSLL